MRKHREWEDGLDSLDRKAEGMLKLLGSIAPILSLGSTIFLQYGVAARPWYYIGIAFSFLLFVAGVFFCLWCLRPTLRTSLPEVSNALDCIKEYATTDLAMAKFASAFDSIAAGQLLVIVLKANRLRLALMLYVIGLFILFAWTTLMVILSPSVQT